MTLALWGGYGILEKDRGSVMEAEYSNEPSRLSEEEDELGRSV